MALSELLIIWLAKRANADTDPRRIIIMKLHFIQTKRLRCQCDIAPLDPDCCIWRMSLFSFILHAAYRAVLIVFR